MHELSLAQALVDQLEQLRAKEHATAVISVTVNLGALSGVDREALTFAFPLATQGTAVDGASLVIQETPAVVTCDACGEQTRPDLTNLACGKCGSRRVRITEGRDFLILSVELQTT